MAFLLRDGIVVWRPLAERAHVVKADYPPSLLNIRQIFKHVENARPPVMIRRDDETEMWQVMQYRPCQTLAYSYRDPHLYLHCLADIDLWTANGFRTYATI